MKRKASYHHGSLKDEAVRVALKIIQKKGIEDLTLREIAKELGTSATALYRHYADKNAILASVGEEGFRSLIETLRGKLRPNKYCENLNVFAQAYLDYGIQHPSQFTVMFSKELSDKSAYPILKSLAHELVLVLKENLVGLKKGKASVEVEAFSFWAQVHGLTQLILQKQIPQDVKLEVFVKRQLAYLGDSMLGRIGS